MSAARSAGGTSPSTQRPSWGWGRWLNRTDVLIVDTETTGLGRGDEVLSVAIIDTTGRTRFSELVMPLGRIAAAAMSKHGLTRARLEAASARPWADHHEQVAQLIREAAEVLAYNAAFDRRLLEQTAALYGRRLPQAHWTCVMNLRRQGGHRGSLAVAAEAEGVPVGETHDALADARTTLAMIRAMAARENPNGLFQQTSRRQIGEPNEGPVVGRVEGRHGDSGRRPQPPALPPDPGERNDEGTAVEIMLENPYRVGRQMTVRSRIGSAVVLPVEVVDGLKLHSHEPAWRLEGGGGDAVEQNGATLTAGPLTVRLGDQSTISYCVVGQAGSEVFVSHAVLSELGVARPHSGRPR